MTWLSPDVATVSVVILVVVFGLILFQEAVNGFHDVANAIATVIYSNSMTPASAVVLAATCNFLGVLMAGTAVAFSLVYLLPQDLVAGVNTQGEAALFFAMIASAVIWNFGTWWLAIPSSTTHAYVGSIIGIAIADALLLGQPIGAQIHWHQGEIILAALLISPLIGFVLGMGLLLALRFTVCSPAMFEPAVAGQRPAFAARSVLIAGSAGVSLLHGSNDGQKSIGLMMIVLFGLAPALYGLDPGRLSATQQALLVSATAQVQQIGQQRGATDLMAAAGALGADLVAHTSLEDLSDVQSIKTREGVLALRSALAKSLDSDVFMAQLSADERQTLTQAYALFLDLIEHVPLWVVLLSAIALGGGTAVGYKKIVTTLGERMGSAHMNPAQGVAAQVSAVISIAMADGGGLPVSTTHVLSSAVIGSVAATPGQQVNRSTLSRIALTWVTTLPATMLLSFALGIVFHLAFA